MNTTDRSSIQNLYINLLSCWNNQDAKGMASLFAKEANVVGFDGSEMKGPVQIETELSKIFKDHKTASYVWKIEEIRSLSPGVGLLTAKVGMVAPGKKEIMPERNAIQSLVVISENEAWKIALFQNTPARFDGRPELVKKMTEELNAIRKNPE